MPPGETTPPSAAASASSAASSTPTRGVTGTGDAAHGARAARQAVHEEGLLLGEGVPDRAHVQARRALEELRHLRAGRQAKAQQGAPRRGRQRGRPAVELEGEPSIGLAREQRHQGRERPPRERARPRGLERRAGGERDHPAGPHASRGAERERWRPVGEGGARRPSRGRGLEPMEARHPQPRARLRVGPPSPRA
jgi:hypothetical protein